MIVLGLHFEHDAGATLMKDGEIAVSIEAERITGRKHDNGPAAIGESIRAALAQTGIRAEEIDALAYSDLWRDNLYSAKLDRRPDIQAQTHGPRLAAELGTFEGTGFNNLIPSSVGLIRSEIPVFVTCHSINHAACALYMSGLGNAAGLVTDGYGTCCGTMGYVYRDGTLSRLEAYRDRFLLGLGFSGIGILAQEIRDTESLDLAGKVMGLNAYGQANREWVAYFRDKVFSSSAETGYDDYIGQVGRYDPRSTQHFFDDLVPGGLSVGGTTVMDPVYRNLVASMQAAFTEIMRDTVSDLVAETGETEIFISGGCGLNIIANAAVAALPEVSSVFVPPNSNDSGQAMGCAIAAMHAMTGAPLHRPEISARRRGDAFIGAVLLDDPSESILPEGITRSHFEWSDKPNLTEFAEHLMAGKIVGVVTGASEIGPRALGNRSILALASYPQMKDIINHKVKRREWWRPFAPVCRLCDTATYFDVRTASRYMLMNEVVRAEWRQTLSSITHFDNTCRLQVIHSREDNSHLWDLLTQLSSNGAIPILLNTSYNLSRKPLVNSAAEAVRLLAESEMDGAVIGNCFFAKKPPSLTAAS